MRELEKCEYLPSRRSLLYKASLTFNQLNLVDPASSHTLVFKIKPCMYKCFVFCNIRLQTAHYNSYCIIEIIF